MNALHSSIMIWLKVLVLPLAIFSLAGCATSADEETGAGDLLVVGRTLVPSNHPVMPTAALSQGYDVAGGVLIRDGKIAALLDTAEAELLAATTRARVVRVPASGVAMAGVIESHAHLLGLGAGTRLLDLRATRSAEEVAALVQEHARSLPAGTWIQGRGWNQELWAERVFPDRAMLDAVAPEHPVVLTRIDGHALLANTVALRIAGIDASTQNPEGGEILRRRDGTPSGVFVDNAEALITSHVPTEGGTELVERDLLAAQDLALSLGITTFVDAGISPAVLAVLRGLYDDGRMKMRVYGMKSVGGSAEAARACAEPPLIGAHEGRLDVRALKMYADGALGSRGAWLLASYDDRENYTGLPVTPPAVIRSTASLALASGYQLCVHAIGDRANREVLDAVEAATAGSPPLDHRFRIEHSQILDPADIPRFAALGVLPSMQTCHAASDGPWVPDRIGQQRTAAGAYVWQSLLALGSIIPNGTDAPVEHPSPWLNLHAALTREHPGEHRAAPFSPEQRLDAVEGLLSLTEWGAYGIFAENRRGRVAPGFEADLVILDKNPLTIAPSELGDIAVEATIVAGEVVFDGQRKNPSSGMAFVPIRPLDGGCCAPHETWSQVFEDHGTYAETEGSAHHH